MSTVYTLTAPITAAGAPNLAAVGLVIARKSGNQKHCQADLPAPIFEERRRLVMKTSGLVDVVRSALAPIAVEIVAAYVYGSFAKRVDTASNDIDPMIESDTLGYAEVFQLLNRPRILNSEH